MACQCVPVHLCMPARCCASHRNGGPTQPVQQHTYGRGRRKDTLDSPLATNKEGERREHWRVSPAPV
jgi:hypothetical protein